jgi:hypothetical protein
MILGCYESGKSLKGYIDNGLIELHTLEKRHKELAREMEVRGYQHSSPLKAVLPRVGEVDSQKSLRDLVSRCHDCAKRTAIWFIGGFE